MPSSFAMFRTALRLALVVGLLGAGACSNGTNDNGQPDASATVDMSGGGGGGGSPDMGGAQDLSTPPDLAWTPNDVAKYVNPIIGTSGGETWPGADTPFGMLQWSPENTRGNQTRTTSP